MFTLKQYQTETLDLLRQFLEDARFGDHPAAFEAHRTQSAKLAMPLPYRPLENILERAYHLCCITSLFGTGLSAGLVARPHKYDP